MLFRKFHCDPNSLTLDDLVISRPDYVSVAQWLEFWEGLSDGTYHDGYDDGLKENSHLEYSDKDIDNAYDEGYAQCEKDNGLD